MAFQDEYEQLFGPQPAYEPLDPAARAPGGQRAAINVGLQQASPGGTSNDDDVFDALFAGLEPAAPAAAPKDNPFWTDVAKNVGSNLVGLGGAVAGIPEYVARQSARISRNVGADPETTQGIETAAGVLAAPRRALDTAARNIQGTMSEQDIDRVGRELFTLDPNRTLWRGGAKEVAASIFLKSSGAAPASLATLLPYAMLVKAGMTRGAITYLGASEGAISVGSIANNIAEEIEQSPDDQLQAGSERYRALRAELGEDEAKSQLIGEAQGMAPAVGGWAVGLLSAAGGRYLTPKIGDGSGMVGRFASGFAEEAAQEGSQSAAEQIAQNIGAQTFDQHRGTFDGALEAAGQGAIAGGPVGGVITAVAGAPRRTALPSGPEATPEVAPPEAPLAPSGSPAASFEDVFGPNAQPGQPETFDSVFQPPERTAIPWTSQVRARDEFVKDPGKVAKRQSEMPRYIVEGTVNPDLQAALNARADGKITDLFEQDPTPQEQQAAYLQNPYPVQQTALPLRQPVNDLVPVPGQQELPLTQRQRGGLAPVGPGFQGQPLQTDMSQPPGFAGPNGQAIDENQIDAFSQQEIADQDAPSAEPLADLQAQLKDLADPDSSRKGVYLSRANITQLRQNGLQELVRGGGVPLANFDGKGGTLIAKNRAAADELIQLRDSGAGDIQEVLGLATTAGAGKTPGANITVQLRDEDGNVVRESLQTDDAAADQLAQEWEAETGLEAAIISLPQALKRRKAGLRQDEQSGETQRVMKETRKAMESELTEGDTDRLMTKVGRRAPLSMEHAARKVTAAAVRDRQKEMRKQFGGMDSPDSLDFNDLKNAQDYEAAFNELAGQQIMSNTGTQNERAAAKAKQNQLKARLTRIRDADKATPKSARVARVAQKLAPAETRKIREAQVTRKPEGKAEEAYTPADDARIEQMTDDEVAIAFDRAAREKAGRPKERKTLDEIKAAYGKNPSSMRKALSREYANSLRRLHGTTKTKSKGVIRSALTKDGAEGPTRRGGKVKPGKRANRDIGTLSSTPLTNEVPARELSKRDRAALESRARKAFDGLESSLANVNSLIAKFSALKVMQDGEQSSDMLMARAYLRTLGQFANSLQKANNRGRASAIKVVEQLNMLVDRAAAMTPEHFAQRFGKLYNAEINEAVRAAAKSDPVVLGKLAYKGSRAEMTEKSVARVHERTQLLNRMRSFWQTDGHYRNSVGPLMNKFIKSIADVGDAAYRPTLDELRRVQFALRMWKSNDTKRTELYEPIKKFFKGLGVDIEGLKLTDDFKWETPDTVLLKRDRFKDAVEPKSLRDASESHAEIQQRYQRNAAEREIAAADMAPIDSAVEAAGQTLALNSAITKFRKEVNGGSVLDILQAEEDFLQTLSTLGRYTETSKNLGLGRVTLPGAVKDTQVSIRKIGPRLRAGTLTKAEAVELVNSTYKSVPIPEELRRDPRLKEIRDSALKPALKDLKLTGEIREAMRVNDMTSEQRRLNAALLRRDKAHELILDELAMSPTDARYATKKITEAMNAPKGTTLGSALETLSAALSPDHPYQTLIQRLRKLNMSVQLQWDDMNAAKRKGVAVYENGVYNDKAWQRIFFIRQNFNSIDTKDPSPYFVQVLLHEAVHAATAGELKHNPRVRKLMQAIMAQARISAKEQGVSLMLSNGRELYGFRDNSTDEFVAELFSNDMFQETLKSIKLSPQQSVWDVIINFLKQLLGLPDSPKAENALDAALATSDLLLTGRLEKAGSAHNMDLDAFSNTTVSDVLDTNGRTMAAMKSVWQRAKDAGGQVSLSVLTMEQLRDAYQNHFKRANGDNPMAAYMRAFFQRNADNSAGMEHADKLSRKWTALTEQNAEASAEMSRLMTEATVHGMHIDQPVTAEVNAHLKHEAQKTKHAELAARFKKMPAEFREHYEDMADYYDETLREEVNLLTINALRGALTTGRNAPMDPKEFDYTAADVEDLKLNTLKGLQEEFGGYLEDSTLKRVYRLSSIPAIRKGAYFPMTRFGDFVVYATKDLPSKSFADKQAAMAYRDEQRANDPTLSVSLHVTDNGYRVDIEEKDFRMAESRSEAEAARREMVAQYGEENVTPVQLKEQLFANKAAISSNSQLGVLLGKLGENPAAQQALKNFYLQSLADSSFRKHEAKRKNVRGVNYEGQHRSFATYAKASAYYTSQLKYGWQMADARKELAQTVREHRDEATISGVRMGEVAREIALRDEMTHDMPKVSKIVRTGVELGHFMLLTSPSYWMINATQPYTVTLPWLAARSSAVQAAGALANAQKMIASPLMSQMFKSWGGARALFKNQKATVEEAFSVIDQIETQIKERGGDRAPEYLKMLKTLKDNSVIDLSFVAELRDIASGKQSVFSNVLDASRLMSHLTEVNNRVMTALAAYDIARAKGQDATAATEFAQQAVSLTQFNYSAGNKARLFQGGIKPMIFQFMQYPQHIYALLISNMHAAVKGGQLERKVAIKTLAGIFATHLAAGGLIGMTLQPVKWAMGLAAFLFGDDDEPYNFDQSVREATAELFGTEMGAVVSQGLPRLVGVDLSTRMSLGTLYNADLKLDNSTSFLGSMLQSFGGPTVGMIASAFRASQYAAEGDMAKAVEMVMPKIGRDAMRAARFSDGGMTDADGKVILGADDMSGYQLFLQSIGLNPAQVSERYAQREAQNEAKTFDKGRRNKLLKAFRNADSPEERADVVRRVTEFNKANPEAAITRSNLIRSAVGKQEAEARIRAFGGNFRGREVLYSRRGEFAEDFTEEEAP